MAGTEKSTIPCTVARIFHEENMLEASFFFKRGEGDRGNLIRFFTTITRQLATQLPEIIAGIREVINPSHPQHHSKVAKGVV